MRRGDRRVGGVPVDEHGLAPQRLEAGQVGIAGGGRDPLLDRVGEVATGDELEGVLLRRVPQPQARAVRVEQALAGVEDLLEHRLQRVRAGHLRREPAERVRPGPPDQPQRRFRGFRRALGSPIQEPFEIGAAEAELATGTLAKGRELAACAPRAHRSRGARRRDAQPGTASAARRPGQAAQRVPSGLQQLPVGAAPAAPACVVRACTPS